MTWDVTALIAAETAASLLNTGLELCAAVELPVTSWRAGDSTYTWLRYTADALATRDTAAANLAKSAWLSTATGAWLTLLAREVYGVERQQAVASTPTCVLSNAKGARYVKAAGEIIVKCSATGVTFRSTAAVTIESGPGTTATVALIADVAGSDGTVGTDDIDEVVTTMLGVTVSSSTAAAGIDEQTDESLREECTASLGALSPNGPPDAYVAVALNPELTGYDTITRATSSEDASDGTVTLWIASASGAVTTEVVAAVQAAVELWATPCCVTPTVASATNAPQTYALTISGDDVPSTAATDIQAIVTTYLSTLAIGGFQSASAVSSLVHTYLVDAGATDVLVAVTAPASGALTAGTVATLATCTVTEV